MNRLQAINAVYQVVIQALEDAKTNPDFPIDSNRSVDSYLALRNNEFAEPQNEPWIAMEVDVVEQEQIGFGGRGRGLFETRAELNCEIYTPLGENITAGVTIAAEIIKTVQGQTLMAKDDKDMPVGELRFFEAYDQHGDRDDTWEMTTLTASFQYEEENR